MSPRARLAAAAAGLVLAAAAGCGEKIAIPRPEGLFSVSAYILDKRYAEAAPVQIAVISNNLFVLSADGALVKRDLSYGEIVRAAGLQQPTAFCPGHLPDLVYVWEQGPRRVRVLRTSDLAPVDSSATLSEVQGVVTISSCRTGIEAVAGARSFIYLADPSAGVIHRYAYTAGGGETGFSPYGILARAGGEAARFVHEPGGMAVDAGGMLLACDADTLRNWVIRFDPTPDPTDTQPDWNGQDPVRGRAVPFGAATCEPASAADVTLGDAAECGETGWTGGRSAAEGEFDRPLALAVDGRGRVYVADSGNDRVQIFTAAGDYEMQFGSAERSWTGASVPRG